MRSLHLPLSAVVPSLTRLCCATISCDSEGKVHWAPGGHSFLQWLFQTAIVFSSIVLPLYLHSLDNTTDNLIEDQYFEILAIRLCRVQYCFRTSLCFCMVYRRLNGADGRKRTWPKKRQWKMERDRRYGANRRNCLSVPTMRWTINVWRFDAGRYSSLYLGTVSMVVSEDWAHWSQRQDGWKQIHEIK